MQKEVKYAGYTAVPDDYNSADGELSASLNIMPEDGSMRVVLPSSLKLQLNENEEVVYIHKSANRYTHYIVRNTAQRKLYWGIDKGNKRLGRYSAPDENELTPLYTFAENEEMFDITGVGNVLVLLTSKERTYIYCFSENNEYQYRVLGNRVPSVKLQFALKSQFIETGIPEVVYVDGGSNDIQINRDDYNFDFESGTFDQGQEEKLTRVSTAAHGMANKFIADFTAKGFFIFPFFVRYAVRMFDGDSYVSQSAPILMVTCNRNMPALSIRDGNKGVLSVILHTLQYKALNAADLEPWGDIIRSIDIFVSAPIYTYDINENLVQNRKITRDELNSIFCIGKNVQPAYRFDHADYETFTEYYSTTDTCYQIYSSGAAVRTWMPVISWYNDCSTLSFKYFDEENMRKKIRDCSDFYHLTSIKPADLKNYLTNVEFEQGKLSTLVAAADTLPDDYNSNDNITAKGCYVYNSRLNLFNIETVPHSPANALCLQTYSNGFNEFRGMDIPQNGRSAYDDHHDDEQQEQGEEWQTNLGPSETYIQTIYGEKKTASLKIWIVLQVNESDTAIVATQENPDPLHEDSNTICPGTFPYYIYYPNKNAKYAIVRIIDEDGTHFYKCLMQPHEKLSGSVFYGGMELDVHNLDNVEILSDNYQFGNEADFNRRILLHNRLYTSEVNNPFYFPVTNMNAVGDGEIRALATAAKALSEGQSGVFPLYALTSSGVWSLSVSQTGGWSTNTNITRDVILEGSKPCQLDGSVLFATVRGIMELQAEQSLCLTEALDTPNVFSPLSLQGTSALIQHADSNNWLDTFTDDQLQIRAFRDFISHCRMAYDYNNQRVLFFNPDYDSDQNKYKFQYAYVYSITEKAWGMTTSILHSTVNSYPEALAMGHDNALYNLSVPDPSRQYERIPAYILTRPLKLDYPDVLKTIDTIIQRGVFSDAIIRQALYASRDMQHWHLVWSSGDRYLRGFRGTPYKYYRLAVFLQMRKTDSINGITVQFQPRLTNQPR